MMKKLISELYYKKKFKMMFGQQIKAKLHAH